MNLDYKSIGSFFLIIGCLYFFALTLASNSPLINLFNQRASLIFGQSWVETFFAILIIFGVLIIWRGKFLSTLLKQCIIILIFVSALLNFPVIDKADLSYQVHGGFLSYPVIVALQAAFGNNPVAIKSMTILLFVAVLIWLLYTINIPIPKIKLQAASDNDSYIPNKTTKEHKESWSSWRFASRKLSQDEEIKKKIQESAPWWSKRIWTGSALDLLLGKKSTAIKASHDEMPRDRVSDQHPTDWYSKESVKQLLLDKVAHKIQSQSHHTFATDKPTFSTQLMDLPPISNPNVDQEFLVEKAKALQNKLIEFWLPVHFEWVDRGPTVIQIKIKPDAGIRVSEVERLKADIASGLKAKSLRIIAPIPGTDLVWIEMPNPKPQLVVLSEILSSPEFVEAMKKSSTNLALGKAVNGSIMVKQLESMPHLLIAGATGSWKSVGINNFIFSLMYQNTPSELKFLMVDPKQVELEFFNGLPYLLAPIVTKPDNALKILKRSVDEMERRYEAFKKVRVKNLTEYNGKIADQKMYRIVIVIDELADLMMSGSKKEVELCITRIAQKARAVGMHLIVATQRPSVNVITGLIKANIPTRIAFGVVSQIDSRTILDIKWAEDLVGKGDMLYMDPANKFPQRIQNPFISTSETERIITSLTDKYMKGLTESDIYDPEIISILEGKTSVGWSISDYIAGSNDDDSLTEQAIEIIMETRKASTTLLQRRLGIGFARAGKIMDVLEQRGMVWPQDGAKPREIYI